MQVGSVAGSIVAADFGVQEVDAGIGVFEGWVVVVEVVMEMYGGVQIVCPEVENVIDVSLVHVVYSQLSLIPAGGSLRRWSFSHSR